MFGRFELYSQGLVALETQPRRVKRSVAACLPCREQKKACDNGEPTCGRCRITGRRCIQPVPRRLRKPSQSKLRRSRSVSAELESPQHMSNAGISPISLRESSLSIIPHRKAVHLLPPPCTLTSECDLKSLPCSLIDLLTVFDSFSHSRYLGPEKSMLTLGLPILVQSPTMLHSWISCSAAILGLENPHWRIEAMKHQNKALQSLRKGLYMDKNATGEDRLATMLMLHLSEQVDSDRRRTYPRIHLLAAYQMQGLLYQNRVPRSLHETLLLESLIYHTAIANTFSPDSFLSTQNIDDLVELWARSEAIKEDGYSIYSQSLLCGLTPMLMSIIFRVGRGIHVPETEAELTNILQILEISILAESRRRENFISSEECLFSSIRYLYLIAAKILMLFANGTANRNIDLLGLEKLSIEGYRTMQEVPLMSSVILYPLSILGTMAVDQKNQVYYQNCVLQLSDNSGRKSVESILSFWQHAWAPSSSVEEVTGSHGINSIRLSQRLIGLNIFRDAEILRSVVI